MSTSTMPTSMASASDGTGSGTATPTTTSAPPTTGDECPEGTEGCPCFMDLSCGGGLVCDAGFCIPGAEGSSSSSGGGSTSTGEPGTSTGE